VDKACLPEREMVDLWTALIPRFLLAARRSLRRRPLFVDPREPIQHEVRLQGLGSPLGRASRGVRLRGLALRLSKASRGPLDKMVLFVFHVRTQSEDGRFFRSLSPHKPPGAAPLTPPQSCLANRAEAG